MFNNHRKQLLNNYSDDTTSYDIGNSPEKVVSEIKYIIEKLFTWFPQNETKTQKMTHAFEYYRIIKLPNISDTVKAQSKKLWEIIFDNKAKV